MSREMIYAFDPRAIARRILHDRMPEKELVRLHAGATLLFPGGEWAGVLREAIAKKHKTIGLKRIMEQSAEIACFAPREKKEKVDD
jgi:hypothetical protein